MISYLKLQARHRRLVRGDGRRERGGRGHGRGRALEVEAEAAADGHGRGRGRDQGSLSKVQGQNSIEECHYLRTAIQ